MDELKTIRSTGILQYSQLPAIKLAVIIDPQMAKYYRSLVPKHINLGKPMYDPHISVVRHEIPPNMEFWSKYEGEVIEFFYDPYVYFSKTYCWIRVFSVRLEEIREELGLTRHSHITRPPDEAPCFHTTIGNFKHLLK